MGVFGYTVSVVIGQGLLSGCLAIGGCNIIEGVCDIMIDVLSPLDDTPAHVSHHVETSKTETT